MSGGGGGAELETEFDICLLGFDGHRAVGLGQASARPVGAPLARGSSAPAGS